jgi:hypothetical protein
MTFLRKVWEGWKRVGQAIGDFMGRAVLTLFYYTIFMPFGLGTRFFSDPLDIKENRQQPKWVSRQTTDRTLEDARRQA